MSSRTFTAKVLRAPDLAPRGALVYAGPRIRVRLTKLGHHTPHVSGPALIDTGSGHCVIALETVRHLGLQPVGETIVETQGGARPSSLYPVEMTVEDGELPPIRRPGVVGSPYLMRSGLAAIIGRDALEGVRFTYDGVTGTFTLEYPGV